MTNLSYIGIAAIKGCYAPYHTMPAFEQGFADYTASAPYKSLRGVEAQAYDRGCEAAMKVLRLAEWIENNVGSN